MHRRWLVNKTNPDYIDFLARAASISPLLAQIMVNRGLKTASDVGSFLRPDASQLSDPFDMQGMNPAVERILWARESGERVLVHGDYDADGITATSIMISALKELGIDCTFFIPNRMEHGYGFKSEGVERAKRLGVKLIITVDCGISSHHAADLCRRGGIDVIITDHHEPVHAGDGPFTPGEYSLPDAIAIVNPRVSSRQSSVAHLSGAGVAFKIAQALTISARHALDLDSLLDLTALGTMADVVPLTDENRLLVKAGISTMEQGMRPGVRALREVSGISGKALRSGPILFTMIPRINAAGRIAEADAAVRLFLTDSEEEAFAIASQLKELNSERQKIEEQVYQEALMQLEKKGIRPVIVVSSGSWHKGVIGIVASRLAEKFCRPAFVIALEGDQARGSARSIPSFDICDALRRCGEVLLGFGGHKQAAGLELETKSIPLFEDRINSIAGETLSEEDFVSTLEIDAVAELPEVGFSLVREIGMLEPFGCGNPEPLIGSRTLEVIYPKVLKDAHLKMKLRQKDQALDAIGFNMSGFFQHLNASSRVDVVYTPSVNEWEGKRSVQLHLKAIRPSKQTK